MKKRTGKETSKKSFGAFEILSCIAIVALMIISVNCYIKKYEYVTGWQNAIKILENTLKKLTK